MKRFKYRPDNRYKSQKALNYGVKWDCHRLIDLLFGTKHKDRTRAYQWLRRNTQIAHFENEQDYGKLSAARKKLQQYAIRKRYLTPDELEYW